MIQLMFCHSNWFNLIVENFHVFYKLSCFQCFFAPYNEIICDQSCVHLQCNSNTLLNCSFDIFSIFPFGLIFLASLNNHHLFFWHHWYFIANIISLFSCLFFIGLFFVMFEIIVMVFKCELNSSFSLCFVTCNFVMHGGPFNLMTHVD